jgi:hypothetical protein
MLIGEAVRICAFGACHLEYRARLLRQGYGVPRELAILHSERQVEAASCRFGLGNAAGSRVYVIPTRLCWVACSRYRNKRDSRL